LFLIGDSDPLIPVDTAEDYCRQVRAVDATCIVEIFPNAGHAWFNYEPAGYEGTLAAALNALKAWAQKAEE
jgi:dienelactone hydrolase